MVFNTGHWLLLSEQYRHQGGQSLYNIVGYIFPLPFPTFPPFPSCIFPCAPNQDIGGSVPIQLRLTPLISIGFREFELELS